MYSTKSVFALALAAASLAAAQPAAAQSVLIPSTPEKGVWLEASRTDDRQVEMDFPSAVWYFSGRLPLSARIRAVADLPFSYVRHVEPGRSIQHGTKVKESYVLGNPYLGVEFAATPRLLLEMGTRAPLATSSEYNGPVIEDRAVFFGSADPHRAEAFLEDVMPFHGAVTYEQPLAAGLSVRSRAGVTAVLPIREQAVEGEASRETEARVDYGLFGSYSAGRARLGAGVLGHWDASAAEGSFAENSLHQLGITADLLVGRVRPGISYRMPLDNEYRERAGHTVGVYLQLPLR